jgi:hypothetical protein
MKTLLASILGLTALTSVALAGEPLHRDAVQLQLMRLTQTQMDQVTAGQPTATANITSATASASGPNSADTSATGDTTTAVTGGLAPSATSTLSLMLSSSSN